MKILREIISNTKERSGELFITEEHVMCKCEIIEDAYNVEKLNNIIKIVMAIIMDMWYDVKAIMEK